MTESAPTAEQAESGATSVAARARTLLRRFDLASLGLLGFLSLPAYVSDALAFLEVFGVFFLFFLWVFIGPLIDMVLARGTATETEPTDWITAGGRRDVAVAMLLLPVTFLNPLTVTQDLLQFLGRGVAHLRYRGAVPDAENYEQQVSYRLPFDGTWTVANGSPEREYSHSWLYVNQRYAYDFLITDEDGRSRPEGAGTALENYYCYDEPVLAPADGVVVETYDTALETSRGGGLSHPLKRDIRGGYVVIKHAEAEYSTLAHLTPGSVTVEPGESVARGEQVGRCGHTGNSSEPHLHFQVQDHPNFALAASLPVQFDDVRVESPGVRHDEATVPGVDTQDDPQIDGHHDSTFILAGQRLAHAGDSESGSEATPESARSSRETATHGVGSRWVTSTLQHASFGLAVGGVLTFVAGLFTAGLAVAAVLAVAAAAGISFRYAYPLLGGPGQQRRSVGTALGLGLAAATVVAAVVSGVVGLGTLTGLLLLVGVSGFVAFGELERVHLRDARPLAG